MSVNLQRCLPEIQAIFKVKNKSKQKEMLRQMADKECFYLAVKEIARNIIKGNIDMTSKEKKLLKRYKKSIVGLACNKHKSTRKRHLIQSGGWLGIALPLVATLLAKLF